MSYRKELMELAFSTNSENDFYDGLVDLNAARSRNLHATQFFRDFNNGTSIVEDDIMLSKYIAAYAHKHFAKLDFVLKNVEGNHLGNKKLIVDYGCGQAIGTISILRWALFNFGRGFFDGLYVKLIEPSSEALCRAVSHINKFCTVYGLPIINVDCFQNLLGNGIAALVSGEPTIHVFSNILDVPSVDSRILVDELKDTSGIYICASPYIDDVRNAWSRDFAMAISNRQFVEMSQQIKGVRYYDVYRDCYDSCGVAFHGGYFVR